MTQIKIVLASSTAPLPKYVIPFESRRERSFRTLHNLAHYPKKHFSAIEIDTDLDAINKVMESSLEFLHYVDVPTIALVMVAILLSVVGIILSMGKGMIDWFLVAGLIFILCGIVSFGLSHLMCRYIHRYSLRKVAEKLEEINTRYSHRGITWALTHPRVMPTLDIGGKRTKSSASKVCPSTFVVLAKEPSPMIIVTAPSRHQPLLGNEVIPNEQQCLLREQSSAAHQPLRLSDIVVVSSSSTASSSSSGMCGRVKSISCLHCGLRIPPPTKLLKFQPSCAGCGRPMDVPMKYFSDPLDGYSPSASPNTLTPSSSLLAAAV